MTATVLPLCTTSPALRSTLPIEVLSSVLRPLPRHDLTVCLRVNTVFYHVARRVLYHTIDLPSPRQTVECILQLSRKPYLQCLVRCLHVNWSETTQPTRNLYQLLHHVLERLPYLADLSLEFPQHHSPFWILRGVPFALRKFSTSLPSKQPLANFLNTQPSITDLTLRGYEQLGPHFASTSTSSNFPNHEFSFILLPTSLPNLTSLRTIHEGPRVIRSVVSGRPVQAASIALFPSLASASLEALRMSIGPMKRLSVMSFDPSASDHLLSEIAERFPALEALHIVILLAEFNNDLLRASGPLLAGFKKLRYLTLMSRTDESSTDNDQGIAELWHHWCPTLKTIILPKGKVWFGNPTESWSTINDDTRLA